MDNFHNNEYRRNHLCYHGESTPLPGIHTGCCQGKVMEYKGVHWRCCGMPKGTNLAKVMIYSEKIKHVARPSGCHDRLVWRHHKQPGNRNSKIQKIPYVHVATVLIKSIYAHSEKDTLGLDCTSPMLPRHYKAIIRMVLGSD